jgi:hypothetical protein
LIRAVSDTLLETFCADARAASNITRLRLGF